MDPPSPQHQPQPNRPTKSPTGGRHSNISQTASDDFTIDSTAFITTFDTISTHTPTMAYVPSSAIILIDEVATALKTAWINGTLTTEELTEVFSYTTLTHKNETVANDIFAALRKFNHASTMDTKPAALPKVTPKGTNKRSHHPPLDLTADDDGDEPAAKRTIVYNVKPPPPHLHEYVNEDMYEPVIDSPGSRLPAPVKHTTLPTRPSCKSFELKFTPEQLKYLQDTIWANRVAPLSHPPMWPKTTPEPSRAVGIAAWLLNSSPELVTECYNMQSDKPYNTQHLRKPHRLSLKTLEPYLPAGLRCHHIENAKIQHLLKPATVTNPQLFYNLPWYTYPIIVEVTVDARLAEQNESCKYVTGYAVFHTQCRALVSVCKDPAYTLLGVNVIDNNELLTAKILDNNKNRSNKNSRNFRFLGAIAIIPSTATDAEDDP